MRRVGRLGVTGLALLLAAGAAKPPPAPSPENQLMAADRAFSRLSAARGQPYALLASVTNDARVYGAGDAPPTIGRAQVFRRLARREPGTVNREPETAHVSSDGRMGWTAGRWLHTARGKAQVTGHYLTVWVKDRRGTWKIQADMATTEPAGKK